MDLATTIQVTMTAVAVFSAAAAVVSRRGDRHAEVQTDNKMDWREGMRTLVSGAQSDAAAARRDAEDARKAAQRCDDECAKLRTNETLLNQRISFLEIDNKQLKAENQQLRHENEFLAQRVSRLEKEV